MALTSERCLSFQSPHWSISCAAARASFDAPRTASSDSAAINAVASARAAWSGASFFSVDPFAKSAVLSLSPYFSFA